MSSHQNVNGDAPEDYQLLLAGEQTEPSMGKEEQYLKAEGRARDTYARISATGAIAIFLSVTWIIVLSNDPVGVGWFALHPTLQTLALACFTYGILTLQPTSQPKTKAAGLTRHQVAIVFLGIPSLTVGTFAIVYNKWLRGADHFVTWHGTIGICAVLWVVFQVGLGAGSVWFGGSLFGGGAKAKAVWKYHRLSGYILFPMLLLTAHLGGSWSKWGANHSSAGTRFIAFTLAPAVLLASIYTRVRLNKMKFM